MGKIIWDPQALEQVHEIYDYYYEHMSPQVAYDLLNDLMGAPDILEKFPKAGKIEPAFDGVDVEFRFLVVRKHWKLIYFEWEDACHIAVVWDTRNNPDILVQRLSSI